jgi:serine/threonine-protein kinase
LAAPDLRLVERLERRGLDRRAVLTELHRRGKLTRLQAIQIGRDRGHHLLVGSYLLLERLGAGGMGRVFLAKHRQLHRLVALKLVRLDRRHCAATRARFLREVRLISRLNHEHVVHAVDAGFAHGMSFLAMEYVPGPDLGRVVMANGPLDVGRACLYARQAALGLQHIHDRGLIHRDVKPANLGLCASGKSVKVLDIGLAKKNRPGRGASLSNDRRMLGSPDYTSPEQIVDASRADHRTDLYGLGCTLYHLLAGQVPFPGGTVTEKALRHLHEEPLRIEDLRPDLPPGLGDAIRKLMARRRTHRYRTAKEAADALAPFAVPIHLTDDTCAELASLDATRLHRAGGSTSLPSSRSVPELLPARGSRHQ